jgi:hypothetical protein
MRAKDPALFERALDIAIHGVRQPKSKRPLRGLVFLSLDRAQPLDDARRLPMPDTVDALVQEAASRNGFDHWTILADTGGRQGSTPNDPTVQRSKERRSTME